MSTYAQVPHWTLHPKYEEIKMLGNGYYLVSNNGKYGMMNAQEKEIVPIKYDNISPFRSHTAILYSNGRFVGYTNDEGRVKEFQEGQYEVAGQPLFFDGYLLVSNINGYYYIHASDDEIIGPFTGGMPFTEGYAIVKVPRKLKNVLASDYTIQVLSAKTGKIEKLKLGEYDVDDVDFISGVSNGKSIVVLKKRFYEYDFIKETLTPIHSDGNITNKKSRVIANERPINISGDENGFLILFKQGVMTFDKYMRLNSIAYAGKEKINIAIPKELQEEKKSQIMCKSYPNTDLLGLDFNDKEILAPQFEKVQSLWDNDAIVMKDGKYGVVNIDPNHSYKFVLNDNSAIGFEHKTANTNIKVVCPPFMKPSLMTLSSEDDNCHINIDTRKENTNVETSVLSYECTIDIPDEIGLEKSSISTKFALNYDGLRLTSNIIPFDTWFINNYTVQLIKHSIEGSVLNAEILVNNNYHGEKNFFRDVSIETEDSVICNLTKITEEMYSAKFYGWKEGTLHFSVDVTEDGCPTLSYSHSIVVSASNKSEKSVEEETPIAAQAKIKRNVKTKSTTKKEEKKVITHF